MMAKSMNAPFTGRIQKRKTNSLHHSHLTCNTRPVHTVGSTASVERSRHVGFTPDSGRMAATQLNDASGQKLP